MRTQMFERSVLRKLFCFPKRIKRGFFLTKHQTIFPEQQKSCTITLVANCQRFA